MNDINDLIEKYINIVNSERNEKNRLYYKKTRSIITDKFRGVPKSTENGKVPFINWLGLDLWQDLLGINVERMYKDPVYYLNCWLRKKIFYFENFNDCNYFDNFIPIWLGEGYEATFFGCKLLYFKDREPSIDRNYILIKEYKDFNKLGAPDFNNSKPMSNVIDFYNKIKKIVSDNGMEVGFYDWNYGPTALCNYIRGFENFSLDFLTNKQFVRDLMQFIINTRMKWSKERNKILNADKIKDAVISNDDVSVPNVPPGVYKELIFPYEKQLSQYYNNFSYYHNCGPIDPFLDEVIKFKEIDMIHCGPFSDFKKMGQLFKDKSSIELHLHPVKDFIDADEEDFKKRLQDISSYYNNIEVKSYCIRLTSYSHPKLSTNENINKLKRWCDISKKILLND
jgi:hypothetical protein